MTRPVAINLLSGGLDSVTVLHIARAQGFSPIALSFRYGQRHIFELTRAAELCRELGVEHIVLNLDPGLFAGATALVGESQAIPVDRPIDDSIPSTYVPARNILFLAHALALAETRGAYDIFIGVNALDYSGYPDCRPEFIAAFETMANLGMKSGAEGRPLRIHAPLAEMNKAQIIQAGLKLGVDYARTSSCYQPDAAGRPCGRCDSCVLRARGFAGAGLPDPLLTRADVS